MFELEELKQKSLAVKLGIPAVYGGEDVKDMFYTPWRLVEKRITSSILDRSFRGEAD